MLIHFKFQYIIPFTNVFRQTNLAAEGEFANRNILHKSFVCPLRICCHRHIALIEELKLDIGFERFGRRPLKEHFKRFLVAGDGAVRIGGTIYFYLVHSQVGSQLINVVSDKPLLQLEVIIQIVTNRLISGPIKNNYPKLARVDRAEARWQQAWN